MDSTEDLAWPKYLHPVEQSQLWLGNMALYDWQIALLNAAAIPHSRVAVSTANESGKTSVVGLLFLLSVMAAFPRARCYATSGNEEQLRDTLFSLLENIGEKLAAQGFEWEVKQTMRITAPNGSVCVLYVKSDPKSVEGRHGYWDVENGVRYYRPLAYLVEEAKHVHNETHKGIRRIDPDFLLATSTPPEQTEADKNWFWKDAINQDQLDSVVRKRQHDLADTINMNPSKQFTHKIQNVFDSDPIYTFPGEYWNYRRIVTWKSAPHLHTPLKLQERKNIEKKFGKNSAFVRSTLYGIGSEGAADNRVYSEDDIAALRIAMTPDSEFKANHGDTRSAADVSGTADGDAMVLGVRNGTEILYIEEKGGLDDIGQAEYLVTFNRSLGIAPYQFTIDAGGVGAPIANRMEQTLLFHGISRFQANVDPTLDYQFYDRYTELHWTLKELISYKVIVLPWNPTLLQNMRDRRYQEMSSKGGSKIKVEDKKAHRKRVGSSPDVLDMIVYLLSDLPIESVRRGRPLQRQNDDGSNQPLRSGRLPFRKFEEGSTRTRGIMHDLKPQDSLANLMKHQMKIMKMS